MKPGVAVAPDGEQQPEDEPEHPKHRRRHPDADEESLPPPPPPKLRRPPRAEPGQRKRVTPVDGDTGPEEEAELKARPPTSLDLPFSRPSSLARRNL